MGWDKVRSGVGTCGGGCMALGRERGWGALAEAGLEPPGKGALSSCWELRSEEALCFGGTSLLGGRAEMVKLHPISACAWCCLLGTTPVRPCPGI